MMFSKVVNYDIKCGILRFLPAYLYVSVFTLINSNTFFNTLIADIETETHKMTIGDLLFNLFAGMLPPEIFEGEKPIPIKLLTLVLPFFFIILYYPFRDLNGFGSQLLCRSNSRKLWVSSKILYTFLSCIIYFIVLALSVLIFALFKGIKLSMFVNEETVNYFDIYYSELPASGFPLSIGTYFIILIFISFFATALIQLLFSMIIGPLFSYCITVASITASIFVNSAYLPGNYMMLLRYDSVIGDEMQTVINTPINVYSGIIILFIFIMVTTICLYGIFCKRYDILNRVI